MLLVHEKCGTSPSELQELMVDILCHYQVREYADIVFGFIGGGGGGGGEGSFPSHRKYVIHCEYISWYHFSVGMY